MFPDVLVPVKRGARAHPIRETAALASSLLLPSTFPVAIPFMARVTIGVVALLGASRAGAQDATVPSPSRPEDEAGDHDWSFSASANAYVVPEPPAYVQPTFTADRDWVHLKLRYNYEALETGSAWIGYHVGVGDEVRLDLTQTVGWVFGAVPGFAVGYEVTISFWQLELYSEGELVFDPTHSLESYFYNWSELRLTLLDRLLVGVVVQRTRAFESQLDLQRGFFVGLTDPQVDVTVYLFNPDVEPTFVLGLDLRF